MTDKVVSAKAMTARAIGSVKKSSLRARLMIGVAAVSVVTSIGWNTIALTSLLANRRDYNEKHKALETQKLKPKPQTGDVFCTVDTYLTDEQVATRKPATVTKPCARLEDLPASAKGSPDAAAVLGGFVQLIASFAEWPGDSVSTATSQ